MNDSYSQNQNLDHKIHHLKQQLRQQRYIHQNNLKNMHSSVKLTSTQKHPNTQRAALAKKYHLKYEDTIDLRKNGLTELNAMIGLNSVKDLIKHYIADAEITKRARALGQNSQMSSLNMIFMGNPGTGKTAVARLVGKILFQKHIIQKPLFKECSARDLLSTLVGGALLKTHRLVKEACGGVLFIDEAYILAPNDSQHDAEDSSKQDAISELLRMAENYRNDTVIILAGYKDRMERLLDHTNEGLRSRFNHKIIFPDYSNQEMFQIFMYHAQQNYCQINSKEQSFLKSKLDKFIKYSKLHHENSNARLMRNLLHMIMGCHRYTLATHTKNVNQLTLEEINKISDQDIVSGIRRAQNNE